MPHQSAFSGYLLSQKSSASSIYRLVFESFLPRHKINLLLGLNKPCVCVYMCMEKAVLVVMRAKWDPELRSLRT